MSEKGNDLLLSILMLILCIFLADCVFNDYEDTKIHKVLEERGISQKIEQFENIINNYIR